MSLSDTVIVCPLIVNVPAEIGTAKADEPSVTPLTSLVELMGLAETALPVSEAAVANWLMFIVYVPGVVPDVAVAVATPEFELAVVTL